MMILNLESKCTGCCSCEQSCPVHCIEMKSDREGFLYPEINVSDCINCGICDKSCPVISKQRWLTTYETPHTYAAWHSNEQKRMSSSSGGAFLALADKMILNGGIVFGCAYDEKLIAHQKSCSSADCLGELQGSKYVQSDSRNTFLEAKTFLKNGIPVLYTGTPCQIDGLLHYLKGDDARLVTCEILCHGVASPKVFALYQAYLTQKYNSTVTKIDFRSKRLRGWTPPTLKISFANRKKHYSLLYMDSYGKGFGTGLFTRLSCFECQYTKLQRKSDFTIADFWGISKDLYSTKGVSLLLANTCKADKYLQTLGDSLTLVEKNIKEAALQNPRFHEPIKKPVRRDNFFEKINSVDYRELCYEFDLFYPLKNRLRDELVYFIKEKVFRG